MSHRDVALWERIKEDVMNDDKGGHKGQWSAIKAMIASKKYKAAGGTYSGKKDTGKGLQKWMSEEWRTKSGKPSLKTGERFLPAKAIKALSAEQYAKTSAIKKRDMAKGKQYSKQPKSIEDIVARFR